MGVVRQLTAALCRLVLSPIHDRAATEIVVAKRASGAGCFTMLNPVVYFASNFRGTATVIYQTGHACEHGLR